MNTATTPWPGETSFDSATYNAFIADLDLSGIELIKIHGERTGAGTATRTRFDLTASYMRDMAVIYYRYELTAHFTDDNDIVLGNAVVSIQVTIRTTVAANQECIEQFGGTSCALIAHPYLREAIASTAQRIGFPDVLLPMIKQQPAERSED